MLAAHLPAQYGEALNLAHAAGISSAEAERRIFGVPQSEVGGYLLGLWGLPPTLVEAVAFHSHPRERLTDGCSTLTAVHVARALLDETESAHAAHICAALDEEYLAQLNLTDRRSAWREAARSFGGLRGVTP